MLSSDIRLTEFASLVNLLTDFDKAGEQSVTGKAKVGPLGFVEKCLLEDQKLQNRKKDLSHQNARLMNNKRKREELSIGFGNFKKCKLHEVGNRQIYDTVRSTFGDDSKSGRLKAGSPTSPSIRPFTTCISSPTWVPSGRQRLRLTRLTVL